MFAKIVACVMSFLLWLFPNCSLLQAKTQSLSPEVVASNLMRAIETNDIALFEGQLCLNIKQNVDDLPGKIKELFDAIEGEVVDYAWRTKGGHFESDGNGKSLQQQILTIDFTTTEGSYRLLGNLELYNNFNPAEMGLRSIALFDPPTADTRVIDIRGTESAGWHD